jgi:ABC-type branched-subunit amino acid transport system substrate-binding protein
MRAGIRGAGLTGSILHAEPRLQEPELSAGTLQWKLALDPVINHTQAKIGRQHVMFRWQTAGALCALLVSLSAVPARAATPGVTDTEIKIGQNAAFSGPASVYGQISTAESHYFQMINDEGGINGRKIKLIALDDAYSPPKAIEVVRRLVEDDEVAILFQTLGTASNVAIRKYVNQKKVPDIWIGSGASVFSASSKDFPWTIQFQPSYRVEGQMYAKYILRNKPDAKIGILYQNDDLGRDYVAGLKDGLGDKFDKMVVKNISYEITDPTIDSQILELKSAGADVLYDASTPKFSAMSIREASDIDWHPLHIIDSNGALVKPRWNRRASTSR